MKSIKIIIIISILLVSNSIFCEAIEHMILEGDAHIRLEKAIDNYIKAINAKYRLKNDPKYYFLETNKYYYCYDQDINLLWKIALSPDRKVIDFLKEGVLVLISGDIYRLVGVKSGKIIHEQILPIFPSIVMANGIECSGVTGKRKALDRSKIPKEMLCEEMPKNSLKIDKEDIILGDEETTIRVKINIDRLRKYDSEKVKKEDIETLPDISPSYSFILTKKFLGYFSAAGILVWKRPRDFDSFKPFLDNILLIARGSNLEVVDVNSWQVLEVIKYQKDILEIMIGHGGYVRLEDGDRESFGYWELIKKYGPKPKKETSVKPPEVNYPQVFTTFKIIKKDELAGKVVVEVEGKKIEADLEKAFVPGEKVNKYPFNIYTEAGASDNHYFPTGLMGNYGGIKIDLQCQNDPHSGNTCIRLAYGPRGSCGTPWAGLYWQMPEKNWGVKIGGYDLSAAKRLTFWARGEKGGEIIDEFVVGGIGGEYADTGIITIGPVELTREWKEYEIDLLKMSDTPERIFQWGVNSYTFSTAKKALSRISGGFGWATNSRHEDIIFYLDDIRYEN